jgi:hypothetical protein
LEQKKVKIDCFKCAHHHITWDVKFPYGCRAMGFKSKQTPSVDVFQSSGEPCHYFEPSKKERPAE